MQGKGSTGFEALEACTDKKENQIFLKYKEIQTRSVAKSYMTITAASYMRKYLRISSYVRKPYLIHDFATAPHSLYMRKILFTFLSVWHMMNKIIHTFFDQTARAHNYYYRVTAVEIRLTLYVYDGMADGWERDGK